jgi:hypothetical protein
MKKTLISQNLKEDIEKKGTHLESLCSPRLTRTTIKTLEESCPSLERWGHYNRYIKYSQKSF